MIHCGELLPNILQLFIEKAASSQIASEIHILKFELLEHFVAGILSIHVNAPHTRCCWVGIDKIYIFFKYSYNITIYF